jgi:DNA-binding GntR family transcriptional regulator
VLARDRDRAARVLESHLRATTNVLLKAVFSNLTQESA